MSSALSDAVDIPVDDVIKRWASENIGRIIKAYTQKGGWEGWAQVEIATALSDYRRASFARAGDALRAALTRTLREEPVYPSTLTAKGGTSQKRADIVVEVGGPESREFVIIELKCEGANNSAAFVAATNDDIAKVQGEIREEYKPARVWALAFSASEEIAEKMRRDRPNANHIILYPAEQGDPRLGPEELKMKPEIILWIFEKRILKLKQ